MNKLVFTVILLMASCMLVSVNNMPLLTVMEGEFRGAAFGWSICSMDFNGDGLKDLVALEKNWNPYDTLVTNQRWGRIRFYWGGTDFDDQAEYDICGTYHLHYGMGFLCNAGDLNNDGYEDLCYWGSEDRIKKICIFYGRQVPMDTPDYTVQFPSSEVDQIGFLDPLGDINNDGHDDIGYVLDCRVSPHAIVRVLDGATMTSSDLYHTQWGVMPCSVRGIGDVNNDGIDDFHVQLPLSTTDNTHNLLSVHFGSSSFPVTDSLSISADTNSLIVPTGCPLGDVNGDGIDDFTSFINDSVKVWYGSANLTPQWDMDFPCISYGGEVWGPYIHGDFNNDGHSDIVTSDYGYGFHNGRAYLWMGGANFNGTVDLVFHAPPGVAEQFGWAMATGDFNGDGFCDLAISQPVSRSGSLTSSGKIHIYLGNAQLADTTVANDDELAPAPHGSRWDFDICPNPLKADNGKLSISFHGEGYRHQQEVMLEIYNIKGQKIYTVPILLNSLIDGKWDFNIGGYPAGVYLARIKAGNSVSVSKRFSVL